MLVDPKMLQEITDVIEKHIRPSLQMDGGDISVISLNGNVLTVKMHGACSCCPRSAETLKLGVERILHELVSNDIVVVNSLCHQNLG